jgi:cell division transport system ATP-binding protein
VVRLDGIGKSNGAGGAVLSETSLTLEPGDFCFVTGASGAGKTALLHIIALAEEPSSGQLTLFDTDAATAGRRTRAALRRRIGIVFQDLRLLDHLSAGDNIALPLRVAGIPDAEIREHVGQVAAWLGIETCVELRPTALSPGERQCLAVARAVVSRPDLLLADDPLSRVDEDTARMLMRAFEQLNRIGTTVVIASPDIPLVQQSQYPRIHLEAGSRAGPKNGPENGLAS